jgi:hypothetical protein
VVDDSAVLVAGGQCPAPRRSWRWWPIALPWVAEQSLEVGRHRADSVGFGGGQSVGSIVAADPEVQPWAFNL